MDRIVFLGRATLAPQTRVHRPAFEAVVATGTDCIDPVACKARGGRVDKAALVRAR